MLIKQLLDAPLAQTAHQEIVYRDVRRFTYLELRDRIGRLASALEKVGVRPGDSVGVLDWDSNRFLEAFFAIPMMGVVLQTVNVRLSPEQIAFTIDHAGSSTLLVNEEFVDLVQSILPQLSKVKRLVVLTDRKTPATGKLEFIGEYEELLGAAQWPACTYPDRRFAGALTDACARLRRECGSLLLHRSGLAPPTPCRSPGAPV